MDLLTKIKLKKEALMNASSLTYDTISMTSLNVESNQSISPII